MYAILDPGTDWIPIKKDLANHLQFVSEAYQLSLNTVGNETKPKRLNRVNFSLWSIDQTEPVTVKVSKKAANEQWNHLSAVVLPELTVLM